MARVIGGEFGGRPLHVPRGAPVRPSMGVVKKAIFSSLGEQLTGLVVLDLFAGVGSLGIEAWSRGAASVTFVERDRRVAGCLRRNLASFGIEAILHEMDVFAYLTRVASPAAFDVAFADPPYADAPAADDPGAALLVHPGLRATVRPGGRLILERRPGSGPVVAPGWEVIRARRYGKTEVVHLRHGGE